MNRSQIVMDQLLAIRAAVNLLQTQVSAVLIIMREELMETARITCDHPIDKRQPLATMGDGSQSWMCRECGYVSAEMDESEVS